MIERCKNSFPEWREAAVFDARVFRGSGEVRDRELQRLRRAVERWGFFELQGHGIEHQRIHDLFTAQRDFFALSSEQKLSLRRTAINSRGYNPGELTKNSLDAKEILDLGHKPDPTAEDDALVNRVADGWNQMPKDAGISEPIWNWFTLCEPLAIEICGWLLNTIGASESLASLAYGHSSFLRLNAYSDAHQLTQSKRKSPDSPVPLGIHRHTDSGLLTLLVEDGHHALQVLHEGQWRMIEPAPNAFIVNTGDMLQVLSNDRFVAPEHRVLGSVGSQYRLSAAYFFNPPYEQVIQSLPSKHSDSIVDQPRYRGFTWEEFRRRRGAGDYEDLGEEVQISHYRI
jgi:isopenicillin N synthase-like dioxygenase